MSLRWAHVILLVLSCSGSFNGSVNALLYIRISDLKTGNLPFEMTILSTVIA